MIAATLRRKSSISNVGSFLHPTGRPYSLWPQHMIESARSFVRIAATPLRYASNWTAAQTFRPNVNLGVPLVLYGSQYPGGKIFNQAAFTPPPKGQQGDFGRNVLRGFGASLNFVAY
jgi:hypothetical protein